MISTLQLESVASPSHKLMNCAFTIAVDSWSEASLDLRKASAIYANIVELSRLEFSSLELSTLKLRLLYYHSLSD